MDDMDIDHVDVPDTPDRLTAQHHSHTNGKECESSIVRFLESPDIANREHGFVPRGDVRVVNRIGPAKRPYMRPPKRISNPNGFVNCSNTIIISSSEKSEPSHSLISQRAKTYQNAGHDHGCYSAILDMDAGMESRSSSCPVDGAAMMNLKDRTASNTSCQKALLYGESKIFLNDQFTQAETETRGNNSRHPPVPFQRLSKSSKGKEKVDESTCRGTGTMSHGKQIDLSDASHDNKKNNGSPKRALELPRNISSAGLAGQKRLVRNGCISPHNITRKVKETAGENRNSFKNSGMCEVHREVSSISSPQTELKEIVAEDESSGRNKGKGILLHPCTSREYEASAVHTSGRNSIITGVENRGNCDASVDVVDCFEKQGDWRSTGNRVNSIHCSGSAAAIGLSRRSTGADSSGQMREIIAEKRSRFYDNKSSGSDTPEDKSAYHATSGQPHCAGTAMKKQRGRGSTSRNESRLGSSESEVVLLGSSENSPDLSPVGFSSRQQRGTLDTVIEIDEFSPDIRQSGTSQVGPTNSYDTDARARQMEADEMLARELQEQLYNESPIDEYVAHVLQGEEQNRTTRTSVGRPRPLVARSSSLMSSRRQPEQELHQSLSSSRRRSRINTSLRSQQSRGRSSRRSSSLSGGRGLQFPSHMDLDTRIDVLEALEAALGDVDDLGLSSSIFHIQRDFNENDYEMLLSLDDSIRQAGASSTEINNLPESKVQTNCEEPCAICLENPTIGEMIRHLPCLHKFHKECIDPWLSRSTSCPVCKSSIS